MTEGSKGASYLVVRLWFLVKGLELFATHSPLPA